MANRLAFSIPKPDIETFFNLQTSKEVIFEPHYNLVPGHQLPTVFTDKKLQRPVISQIRWGKDTNNQTQPSIFKDDVPDILKNKLATPCMLPISGYYMWRGNNEKGQPFFVRMLNHPIMAVAALMFAADTPSVSMITTNANTLLQPMGETMPLALNSTYSLQWMDNPENPDRFLHETSNLFLLTDYSVLKVSKKVNDPANNAESLIQPIPK